MERQVRGPGLRRQPGSHKEGENQRPSSNFPWLDLSQGWCVSQQQPGSPKAAKVIFLG